jgi:phosphoglycerate dehydrogenase-like enzyme
MLRGKYIVNVGRSNCIDQAALYEALLKQEVAGAAIDTWDEKPKDKKTTLFPSKHPFETLDNVVLSPHQATRVRVGHRRYVSDITQKVIAYLQEGKITDQVDLQKGY